MKILVVADTHGFLERLCNVYEQYKDDIDMLIHLGDGCDDIWDLNVEGRIEVLAVRGNNDFDSSRPDVVKREVAGVLVYAEHRPLYSYQRELEKEYKMILYMHGHKHIVNLERRGNVITLSPGTLSRPRDNHPYAYALVDIDDFGDIKIAIRDLDGKTIEKMDKER